MALRTLALCAGIGGLELGVAAAADVQLVGVVERQAFAAATLVARMEEEALDPAPIWSDLATFDGRPWAGAVDLVLAGFPCQPHSLAGRRGGTDDARWLWPHVWRIVREVGARFLFIENVPGLLTSGGLDSVLATLASCGWAAEWGVLSAAAVGAPHKRDRVFLLAADPGRVAVPGLESEWDQRQGWSERAALGGDAQPDDDGAHRPAADADLLGPQHAGAESGAAQDDLGRRAAAAARGGDAPADADGARSRRKRSGRELDEGERSPLGPDADGRGGADAPDAERELGWRELGDDGEELEAVAGGGERWELEEEAEPSLRGTDARPSSWVDQHPWLAGEPATFDGTGELNDDWAERIHSLGNSVCPPQAAAAWRELWSRLMGGAS